MTKITDPKLPVLIWDRISQYPDFKEVFNLVKRNTRGRLYLVGGKLYRTIIELVHGYDCGAKDVDWDFLCMGTVVNRRRAYVEQGWSVDRQDGVYKANSMCLSYWKGGKPSAPPTYRASHSLGGPIYATYNHTKPDNKVDIIGIKDVPFKLGSKQDYFDSVPLDIQMCGISTEGSYPALYGQALKSIETKTIKVNNENGTLRPFDVHSYAGYKASTLHFHYEGGGHYSIAGYHGVRGIRPVPCDCFKNDVASLWRLGCQRKDIHV